MLDLEFMRLAFAAGAIVGVLAPAVGFFLVQREMSLIGDGIGHVAFAGVAGEGLVMHVSHHRPPAALTHAVPSANFQPWDGHARCC